MNSLPLSDDQYFQLIDISPVAFRLCRIDGTILYVNQAFTDMLGYDAEELAGKSSCELVPEAYRAESRQRVEQLIVGGSYRPLEKKLLHKDGSPVDVRVNGLLVEQGGERFVWSVIEEISERKRAEEEMKLAQFVMENAPVNITLLDVDARIRYVNKTACETLGYSREELQQMSIPDIDPQFPMEAWKKIWQELKTNKSANVETEHRRKNGEVFPIEVSANYIEFDGTAYNVAFDRDISARKNAEMALLKSEKELRRIFDQLQDTYYRADTTGCIEVASPSVQSLIGLDPDAIVGRYLADFYVEEDGREKFLAAMQESGGSVRNYEAEVRRADGLKIWVSTNARYIYNDGGEVIGVEGIIRDISERKHLEHQLIHSQKMEAVGTLVGGIAHDFNNTLAAIQGNAYMAQLQLAGNSEVGDFLDRIEQLSDRAAEMVRQLLTFARKDQVSKKPFSLNSFMMDGFRLAKSAIPENIEHSFDLCPDELIVNGDTTQLQQALMNLLNNASHAVRDKPNPQIRCSLYPFEITEAFTVKYPEAKGKEFARLSVADNGCGIAKHELTKIFEPFYTTKDVNEGTGLGLAMVYGSIQTHGGMIEVESDVGEGTVVHIYLPLDSSKIAHPEQEKISITKGNHELILLVDDELDVRSTIGNVLQTIGYRILQAENGMDAVELFREHYDEIDLVLSDVVMPRMNGIEAAAQMRLMKANVPVIFMSGYDKSMVENSANAMERSALLSKPFSYEVLSKQIRTLIDAPGK